VAGRLEWSQSQRMAWQYVKTALDAGLSQSEGLRQYRAGGGEVRTAWWNQLYHQASTAAEAWTEISYLGPTDAIPERLFEPVNINFMRDYVMSFSITGRTASGESTGEFYRYVQSNRRLTWQEWLAAVDQSVRSDPTKPDVVSYEIRDLAFFTKG